MASSKDDSSKDAPKVDSKKGQRLNPFQHALKRPDAYIGSIVTVTKELLTCMPSKNEDEEDEEIQESKRR
jgi:hypothetical protein